MQVAVAVAWFKREDWSSWVDLDRNMIRNYDEWLLKMNAVLPSLERQGIKPVKIELDPANFSLWCVQNDETPGTQSRSRYAALLLQERNAA